MRKSGSIASYRVNSKFDGSNFWEIVILEAVSKPVTLACPESINRVDKLYLDWTRLRLARMT